MKFELVEDTLMKTKVRGKYTELIRAITNAPDGKAVRINVTEFGHRTGNQMRASMDVVAKREGVKFTYSSQGDFVLIKQVRP